MSEHPRVVVVDNPCDDDRNAIFQVILDHNRSHGGPTIFETVAILLRDDKDATIGGLWAKCYYDWMFVEYLAVPPTLRGRNLGSALMAAAEDRAAALGCRGIWLDTFAFQAPGFYEKLGYEVFGRIGNHPAGSERFFFKKQIVRAQADDIGIPGYVADQRR